MEIGIRVLVVEPDSDSRDRIERALEQHGHAFNISMATSGSDALDHLETTAADCVVAAFDLPEMDGLELFDRVQTVAGEVPFVLSPAEGSPELAEQAFAVGVTDYLPRTDGGIVTLAHRIRQDTQDGTVAELARERERFSDLFENFPEPTIAYGFDDGATVFRGVNDAFEDVFGLDGKAIRGQAVNEHIVPEERRSESEDIDQKVESGEMVDRVVRRLAETGPRIFNLRNIPVSAAGEIDGFAVYADITERKENERELKRQNERLEEFASIVSHDLRNPLNVAMGHLEIADQECDSDSIDHVADALGRMEALIGETLQLAKQGQMVTETEPLDLADIVAGCWQMVDNRDATLATEGNLQFRGDPSRVKQLFENLFRNAIDHGGDDVGITVGELEDGFFVADDGPGIPEDERDGIFEPGHTTSEDGTGFGLAIVEEIVEAHDWEITVTEADSGGARFEITGVDVIDGRE